jgi:hypothetical protein
VPECWKLSFLDLVYHGLETCFGSDVCFDGCYAFICADMLEEFFGARGVAHDGEDFAAGAQGGGGHAYADWGCVRVMCGRHEMHGRIGENVSTTAAFGVLQLHGGEGMRGDLLYSC